MPPVNMTPSPSLQLHTEPLQMFEDPVFTGSLVYEYLANETNRASGPYFSNWSGGSPLTGCAYTSFGTPAYPTFVPILHRFPATNQYFLSETTRPSSLHPPCRRFLRNHPPHSTVDNRLRDRAVIKAHPPSATLKESGAAVCARRFSTTSTNATVILGTRESERCVSPAGKFYVQGRTTKNGTTPNIAGGWTSGNTEVLDSKTLLPRFRSYQRWGGRGGGGGEMPFCANLCPQTECPFSCLLFRIF